MSISPVVDGRYRLLPADLHGRSQAVTVTHVTYQGVEELRPVLRFAEFDKRLVLSPGQCNDLAFLTQSAVAEEWIGVSLLLTPVESDGRLTIAISTPDPAAASRLRSPPARGSGRIRSLLFLLLLALLLAAARTLERSERFWQWLQILLEAQ